MSVEFVHPFIESTHELFNTMLASQARHRDATVPGDQAEPHSLWAVVGFSGKVRGTMALRFPMDTALRMANRLRDTDLHAPDDTVSDAIAEMAAIVAGGAAVKRDGDARMELALPTVLRGRSINLAHPGSSARLEVPFDSDLGPFILHVSHESPGHESASRHTRDS